jgi:hypothetical protein
MLRYQEQFERADAEALVDQLSPTNPLTFWS